MSGRNLATITDWIGWDPEARQVARGNSSWDSTRGETVYDNFLKIDSYENKKYNIKNIRSITCHIRIDIVQR